MNIKTALKFLLSTTRIHMSVVRLYQHSMGVTASGTDIIIISIYVLKACSCQIIIQVIHSQ